MSCLAQRSSNYVSQDLISLSFCKNLESSVLVLRKQIILSNSKQLVMLVHMFGMNFGNPVCSKMFFFSLYKLVVVVLKQTTARKLSDTV